MASNLTLTAALQYRGQFTSALDLTTPIQPVSIALSDSFTNGTGAGQANQFFDDERATSAAMDLMSGLTNAFGAAIVFTKIKVITIRNLNVTTGNYLEVYGNFMSRVMQFGSPSSNTFPLQPGGTLHVTSPVDPWLVDATHNFIRVDGFAPSNFDIVIVGIV